jgi:hypoxia-inducible factor 1-alpha inhibitor (HIF hydroxylase)
VNLEAPDYFMFPKVKDLRGFETVVGPGDILYIPNCWWHQVETLSENSVSITFWFKVRQVF